jgi:uncharacterized membrane protein
MNSSILRFANVILAALLAGTSFGIWFGFDPSRFSAPVFIEQHQAIVRSLGFILTTMVILAAIVTALAAYHQRGNKWNMLLLTGAVFCFVACFLISVFGNRPVDNVVMTWTPLTYPRDWTKQRDQWRFYHGLRTVAELAALALVTWASIRRKKIVPVTGWTA